VRQYDTMLIEPATYLNAILTDFRIGGRRAYYTFERVTQAQQPGEAIIFNCIGLGARRFLMIETDPDKGTTYLVASTARSELPRANGRRSLHVSPHRWNFVRRTVSRGEWSLSVDEATRTRVLRGHAQFFRSFRRCPQASLKNFQPARLFGTNRSNLAM
jgi:hypothetical protein